ncbi:MAG: metallophosphoesterase [Alistipes sp.]|nr:metallophosphoesterase [Alistipes sp.]
MLFSFAILLGLCAVAADCHHFRRLKREGAAPLRRRFFVAWAALTDALPLIVAVAGLLLRDHSTAYINWSMWMFWAWMITVFPRIGFYVLNAFHRPLLGVLLGLGIAAIMVWGATSGRTTLRINTLEVCSPRLPAGFDGLRIAQISDLHVGTLVRPDRELRRLVDSINALQPDLIVFTGDLVNIRSSELTPAVMQKLGELAAPVYSVTGNHDTGRYIKDTVAQPADESLAEVIERQTRIGWHVLQDTTIYLHRGNDSIALSGISFDPALHIQRHSSRLQATTLDKTYAGVPDTLFNITAVHLPQLWPQIIESGRGDLTLAGHVHSMQLKIRIFGRNISPASWLYKRWSGPYRQDGRTLYINDGIGYVGYPMRLGAWPEITLITLRKCS